MDNLPKFNTIFMSNFCARLRLRLDDVFIKAYARVCYIDYSASIDITILYNDERYEYIYPLDDDMLCDLSSIDCRRINSVLERLYCYCVEDYKNDIALIAVRERVKEC